MSRAKIWYKRILWCTLFVATLCAIVYFTSQDGKNSESTSTWFANRMWRGSNVIFDFLFGRGISLFTFHFYIRKLAHFSIHLLLAFISVRASVWCVEERKTALRAAWILSIGVAIVDELAQLAVPGRYSALVDVAINLSGVVVGAFFSSLLGPRKA